MTTVVRRQVAAWAAAHRTLSALIALAVVVLATAAVTTVLRLAADESTPGRTTPTPYVEQECTDPPVMLISSRPFC